MILIMIMGFHIIIEIIWLVVCVNPSEKYEDSSLGMAILDGKKHEKTTKIPVPVTTTSQFFMLDPKRG